MRNPAPHDAACDGSAAAPRDLSPLTKTHDTLDDLSNKFDHYNAVYKHDERGDLLATPDLIQNPT